MRNKHSFFIGICVLFGGLIFLSSCKRQGITIPPSLAEFPVSSGSYAIINSSSSKFKIPVGFTTVENEPRTINFTVTSPTGAVKGQQYTLTQEGSITIPAGKSLDSLEVKGIFAGYSTREKDTLIFTITGGSAEPFNGYTTYRLVLQKFCDLNMADFQGVFKVLNDDWEDYLPGDEVTLSVTGNTIYFDYPTPYNHKSIPIVVNPNTFATSVALTAFGSYSAAGTIYSCQSVASVNNVVVPCDKIVSVFMEFSRPSSVLGNGLLRLKKK